MFGTLAEKIEERHIPVTGSLELTWNCNLKCRFCYQYRKDINELNLSEIKEILDELADLGCLFLAFTGGEPLLRPDFWDIAEYAQKKLFSLTLQTNGTLISDDYAKRIKQLIFFDVHISLLGARPETHDYFSKSAGSFDKVIQAIELLRKQGVRVMLKTTVMKQNFSELKEIEKIAKRFRCLQVTSPIVNAKSNGNKTPCRLRLNEQQMRDFYLTEFERFPRQKEEYASHAGEAMVNCRAGRTGFCINPIGEVYPCVGLPVSVGSLREASFKQIWNTSTFIKQIRDINLDALSVCSTCELISICMRCKGMAYLEDGNILMPSKEACRIANIVKEVMDNGKEEV